VLSHDQERQLELIDVHTSIEDPRFAMALGAGLPRRPRQYRSWRWLLELAGAVAAVTGAALLDPAAAVVTAAVSIVVLGSLWARRRLRLDQPPVPRPDRPPTP
jgi:hypothetical protein